MDLEIPSMLPIKGPCLLCGVFCTRQLSHVISAFVIRRLKKTSASGFLRTTGDPDKRVQDGLKDFMLCGKCEQLFCEFETEFANSVYYPHLEDRAHSFTMTEGILRFATSISWRVLVWHKEHKLLGKVSLDINRRLAQAEKVWRDFLLGKRFDVGPYQQHLVVTGLFKSGPVPSDINNFNAYVMRAQDLDIVHSKRTGFIYANLAGFFIVGDIGQPERWEGTLIRPGFDIAENIVLDTSFFEYLFDRARFSASRMAAMSETQSLILNDFAKKNSDRMFASESFAAIEADRDMRR